MAKNSVEILAARPCRAMPAYKPMTVVQYDGGHATMQCECPEATPNISLKDAVAECNK